MLEQFDHEFMNKEDEDELTWDGIKDQLNEDKPIIYDGQFTKEMFLDFCKWLCDTRQNQKRLKIYLFTEEQVSTTSDENLILMYNNYDIICNNTEAYKLMRDRLKKLETRLNTNQNNMEEESANKKALDEDEIFRPINSMSFEEFVEYLS